MSWINSSTDSSSTSIHFAGSHSFAEDVNHWIPSGQDRLPYCTQLLIMWPCSGSTLGERSASCQNHKLCFVPQAMLDTDHAKEFFRLFIWERARLAWSGFVHASSAFRPRAAPLAFPWCCSELCVPTHAWWHWEVLWTCNTALRSERKSSKSWRSVLFINFLSVDTSHSTLQRTRTSKKMPLPKPTFALHDKHTFLPSSCASSDCKRCGCKLVLLLKRCGQDCPELSDCESFVHQNV